MITALELEKLAEPILFPGLTWQQFKIIEPLLDVPGVRVSFLDRLLEIRRMPARKHEVWFWQNGQFPLHDLRTTKTEPFYEAITLGLQVHV